MTGKELNSAPPPLPQIKSLPLRDSSYLVRRSHLLAGLGLYWCQTGMAMLACAHGVKRDQSTALRMQKSAMGCSCRVSRLCLCWKKKLWCFCLLVYSVPVSPSALLTSASISALFVMLPQPQISVFPAPSFNNVLSGVTYQTSSGAVDSYS